MKRFWTPLLLAILICAACQPQTVEDCRKRCEATLSDLASELAGVETTADLRKALPRIRKLYSEIARLMLLAEELAGSDSFSPPRKSAAALHLEAELIRLYEIEGARQLMDSAQAEALALLEES